MLKKNDTSTIMINTSSDEPAVRRNNDFLQKNVDYIKKLEEKKKLEREVAQQKSLEQWCFHGNKPNRSGKGKSQNLNDSKANVKCENNPTPTKDHKAAINENPPPIAKNKALKKRKPLTVSPTSPLIAPPPPAPRSPPLIPPFANPARDINQELDLTNTSHEEILEKQSEGQLTVIMAMEVKTNDGKDFEESTTQGNDANKFECLHQHVICKNDPITKTVEQPTMDELLIAYRDRQPNRNSFALTHTLKNELYDNIPLTNEEPSMADILQMSKSRVQVTQNDAKLPAHTGEVAMSFEEVMSSARRPPPPVRRSHLLTTKPRSPSPDKEEIEEKSEEQTKEDGKEETKVKSNEEYEKEAEALFARHQQQNQKNPFFTYRPSAMIPSRKPSYL